MRSDPVCSVLIPAHNSEAYLPETLDSLLGQTFGAWEAVVVDDGSSDRTAEIVRGYAARDHRIRLFQQPARGVAAARNRGLNECRGAFVAFLDADDLWRPDKLERQLAAAQSSRADLIFCRFECFRSGPDQHRGGEGLGPARHRAGPLAGKELMEGLCLDWFIIPSCVLLRRTALLRAGPFDEALRLKSDLEMWLRMAAGGCQAYGLEELLCRYRIHPSSISNRVVEGYLAQQRVVGRYRAHLAGAAVLSAQRLAFRNAFTEAGRQRCWSDLGAMFEVYRAYDEHGYACRAMSLLSWLPVQLFWLLSRFVIIPLAWHLEKQGELWARRARPAIQP
jgi:glycosyltransferase involved in cell wall biosynthesis